MKKLSWDDIETMTDELAGKIKASGFEPDYIIGITIGGLIPLHFLAKKLGGTSNILTISVNSYNKDKKGSVNIKYMPEVDLSGKKVLLLDEIVGTGDTIKEVSAVLNDKYKVGELKTISLVVLKDSYPYGILSTFDMAAILKPKGRRGERFITEANKRKSEIDKKSVKPYLLNHIDTLQKVFERSDKLHLAEDALTYSQIFQNYALTLEK